MTWKILTAPLEKMSQENQMVDCGVFALASALQIPYERAEKLLFPHFPARPHDGLVDMLMVKRVLRKLGRKYVFLETRQCVASNLHLVQMVANDVHFRVWCPVARRLFDADSFYTEEEMPGYFTWQDPEYFCSIALL